MAAAAGHSSGIVFGTCGADPAPEPAGRGGEGRTLTYALAYLGCVHMGLLSIKAGTIPGT